MNTEWDIPFGEWPAGIREIYTYNKDKARQLLADAGYPNGFKTNILTPNGPDVPLLEIIKSYFSDIGVDMEIKVMADWATYGSTVFQGNQDQIAVMNWLAICDSGPHHALNLRESKTGANLTRNNDEKYDSMVSRFESCSIGEKEKAIEIFRQANMYALQQSWAVNLFGTVSPIAWQSYIKGYSGEGGRRCASQVYARLWIDETLKNK